LNAKINAFLSSPNYLLSQDFLLVLIELFALGVTAKVLGANIGSKSAISLQWGPVDPKFQVEGVTPHQPFIFSEN